MSGVKLKVLTQDLLFEKLKVLFPDKHIHVNVRKDHTFKYDTTGSFLELDCWIPEYHLGLEFQDEYHYVTTWYSSLTQQTIRDRDSEKKRLVMNQGISLISVPCWWDGSHESLGALIKFETPEINLSVVSALPIPLNPPFGYFADDAIPNVGELMLASFPHENKAKSFNWWMGEKYDGVRLCWVNNKQKVYTRTGYEIYLPHPFKLCLPKTYLDGEFWFGRGQFHVTCMVVNSAPEFIHWHELRMVFFDIPFRPVHSKPFEERYDLLLTHISNEHPFAIVVPRMKCKNKYHLNKYAQEIINNGGEGVMLREPESSYIPGRSSSLVKLKSAFCDTEAMVVGIINKYVKLGLPNGKTFIVPPENLFIATPKIGQVVTFSYERRTHTDLPLNPSIIKVREDILWRDVVQNAHKEKKYLNVQSNVLPLDAKATERMRNYLENFAKNQNMNPLIPETWYLLSYSAIQQFQSGKLVLQKFQGSYFKTMRHLFPEIVFDKLLFPEIEKRKAFFEEYARSCSFDFRDPENWYSQRKKKIMSFEGAQQILSFHGGSLSRALIDLFPDINFDKAKFPKPPIWRKTINRKQFFVEFAKENNFDPLVPENWYTQSKKLILAKKGADRVLSYHKHNIPTALLDLFPNIGLDKSLFTRTHQWGEAKNRRKFFERYATENGFDPLDPLAWYSRSRKHIESIMGARRVLFYHNYSVAKALIDLFPEIGLENSKFPLPFRGSLNGTKKFLEDFAAKNSFDPLNPDHWYLHYGNLLQEKQFSGKVFITDVYFGEEKNEKAGGYTNNNNMSVAKALNEIYPNIGLDKQKFPKPGVWYNKANTQKYFEDYAKEYSFDSLVSENWYSHYKDIISRKNSSGIVFYQNQTTVQVLLSLYPNLDKSKLSTTQWINKQEAKQFFDSFAHKNGFDPLSSQNWVTNFAQVQDLKKSTGISFYNNLGIAKVLNEIYPNLNMEIQKPQLPPMWFHPNNRRKWFEEYAQENDFDSLVPENWYIQSHQKILAKKGAKQIIHYHNNNLAKALQDIFPDVYFNEAKLPKPPLWNRVRRQQLLVN